MFYVMKKILLLLCCCVGALSVVAQTEQLDSIYDAALRANNERQSAEAYRLADRYCSLCDTTKATFRYAMMLSCMAASASQTNDRDAAIRLGQRVIDVRRAAEDCEVRHVATALNDEAIYYANVGDYDTAVKLGEEALSIFKEHSYKKDAQYAITLANMSAFLTARGNPEDFKRAIVLGEQSLKDLKKGSPDYLNALNNLAVCYAQDENMAKADEISREVFAVGKKVYAQDPLGYAMMLANHASRLASLRAYAQAVQYADEAVQIFRDEAQTNTLAFAKLLVNRAVVSTAMEHYDESIVLLDEARPLLLSIVGDSHADYMRCMSELSIAYNKKGDTEKAEEYSIQLGRRLGDDAKGDANYARVLNKQAEVVSVSGNYRQAISLVQNAFEIFRQQGDFKEMAVALNKMAGLHISAGDYEAAVDSGLHAVELLRSYGKEPLLLADVLGTVALANYNLERFDTARVYSERSMQIYEQTGDTLSSIYAKSLSNLALYNYACGDTLQAIQIAERAKPLQLSTLGEDHPENVSMFYNLARYYNDIDADKVQTYYHQALQLQTSVVRNNFSHQTTAERETYWNTKSFLFKAAPLMAFLHRDNGELLADAYNAQLFTKGLLLNSEINFRTFLQQTGDSLLLQKFERMELLRRDIDAAFSLPPAERAQRTAGPLAEVARLEKQLVKDCKQFGDFMASFDDDFLDVAAALKPDEMAIELMNLNVRGAGETYIALYLRQGWDSPRCKVLFDDYDLEQIGYGADVLSQSLNTRKGIDKIYRDPRFGQLIWGRLLPELADVKTLYFAPVGMFYQLGAEYLALDSLTTVADRFDCHRLSSTRLVARRTAAPAGYQSATVFGGLEYDMDQAAILAAHVDFQNYEFEMPQDNYTDLALAESALTLDSLAQRGGVGYLAGTLYEADAIGEQLMQHDVPTNMFEGEQGTEEAFKALNGRGQSIIHVATHGFAFTDAELNNHDRFRTLVQDVSTSNPLNRSGLLFAGSNYVLQGGSLPEGIENGILTAREISFLDLSGAELVVMSACRTGVGEVRDDGVFGLQRGFKKAGAVTLLMSLWSVSDAATMTMMSAFYASLMEGKSKHAAFREAQTAVRAAGYDDPFYWASFVMLDDL